MALWLASAVFVVQLLAGMQHKHDLSTFSFDCVSCALSATPSSPPALPALEPVAAAAAQLAYWVHIAHASVERTASPFLTPPSHGPPAAARLS